MGTKASNGSRKKFKQFTQNCKIFQRIYCRRMKNFLLYLAWSFDCRAAGCVCKGTEYLAVVFSFQTSLVTALLRLYAYSACVSGLSTDGIVMRMHSDHCLNLEKLLCSKICLVLCITSDRIRKYHYTILLKSRGFLVAEYGMG